MFLWTSFRLNMRKIFIIVSLILILSLTVILGAHETMKTLDYRGVAGVARSVRNNSPGNVRPGSKPWQGQVGIDGTPENGYVIYDSVYHGMRAMYDVLYNYMFKDDDGSGGHFDTCSKIANRWSPSADSNDPSSKAQSMADQLGVGVDDPLDFKTQGLALGKAIAFTESISAPEYFPNDLYSQAFNEILSEKGV